jgi:hypothetical protein
MLLQDTTQINTIVFTSTILHNILLELDTWAGEDEKYDIVSDISGDIAED